VVQAKPKKDKAAVAEDQQKPKKEKKAKKEKKPKDAAKKEKAKPEAFELTGTLAKTEKNGKASYSLTTGDGVVMLRGKKVADLDDKADQAITITGTGKLTEKGDKKTLVIVKLEGAAPVEN
jgi:hypothetical protein